ncbi:hypothetical protein GALMADRAFT_49920, partial [Galerina marginata CBS 339.88]
VVRMATCSYSPEEIQAFTDVSPRQQRRILKLWKETDTVKAKKTQDLRGRPRHLTMEEVSFLQGQVNSTCDVFLDELQESLSAICGADTHVSTIWRTLKRCGYRMKKVR